jgi:ADP-heptose:LPS heptosyltransferase
MTSVNCMTSVKKILLIRLKSIGDVVLTLPAVNIVRENFPSAKITFLTSKENVSLLAGFREVNEVIPLDRATLSSGNPLKIVPEFIGLIRRLRAGKFSLVIDMQGYGETAWITRLTGASQRWGSVYGSGRAWAYTLGVPRKNQQHHADRSLAILQVGGLNTSALRNHFELPPAELKAAHGFFQQNNLNPAQHTLFLQPFTSSPRKNWPLKSYLAVARHWRAQGWQVIFGGGTGDRDRLDPVLAGQFITSAGVPLLVTGGLMQRSTLVVGGDTGLLHLAVAMGKRVVMIMNSIAPGSAFPFQHPDWAVVPITGDNVSEIQTGAVIEACVRAFAELGTI